MRTQLGERGVRYRADRKQRIAIVSGDISRPAHLLLDEATSALDAAWSKSEVGTGWVDEGKTTILLPIDCLRINAVG